MRPSGHGDTCIDMMDQTTTQVVTVLLENPAIPYNKKQLVKAADVSRKAMDRCWDTLVKHDLVKQSDVGAAGTCPVGDTQGIRSPIPRPAFETPLVGSVKMTTTAVLQSLAALTQDRPDRLVGRTAEQQRIREALNPRSGTETTATLWVFGPAGVGKTACVRNVLEQLAADTGMKTVYINCWQYNTRPALLTELLIRCGYPAPRKGKPVDQLLARLQEVLAKSRGLALALDEFDQLREASDVIYDLQLLRAESEQTLGLILVSNRGPSSHEFDPRSESRLSSQTLEFQPYTAPELVDILEQRAEQAFRSGAVADEAIELIAETVAEQSGDCREALDLLLRVGRRADREGAQQITTETITAVLEVTSSAP